MSKIAIIEDAGILRIKLEKILLKYGLSEIEFVSTNNIGVTKIPNVLRSIGLVIIDLDLHGADALDIILRIRKWKGQAQIPILALTNSSAISILKKAIVAGCSDFVLKPFNDETLVLKAYKLLGIADPGQAISNQSAAPHKENEEETQALRWDKDFAIGIIEIDQEHNEIVYNFEKLYLLMKEGKGHEFSKELLVFLNDYVHRHFGHEEEFMTKIKYTGYEDHHKIHEDFKQKVSKIVEEYSGKSITNSDLIKLNLFIKDWLIHHILIEDRKIGAFFDAGILPHKPDQPK